MFAQRHCSYAQARASDSYTYYKYDDSPLPNIILAPFTILVFTYDHLHLIYASVFVYRFFVGA
jgi:hypothetical protein